VSKPEDRPEPHWKSEEEWYEFFRFTCPSCKLVYVADYGSEFAARYTPKPTVVRARWNPTAAPVTFEAVVICTCLAQFDVKG